MKAIAATVILLMVVVSVVAAGTVAWGPAGPAPQTAPEAHTILQALGPLTVVNHPEPEVSTVVIGWTLGTNDTEARGEQQTGVFPAGTVIDYDPGVTSVNQTLGDTVQFHSKWWRSGVITNTTVTSLKVTAYWTPADLVGGIPQTPPGPTS